MDPSSDPDALPLLSSQVHAGFPSPASDHEDRKLSLRQRFVPRPASMFAMQVVGDSMMGVQVASGDYVIVDRSRDPKDGDVVVAEVDGDLVLRLFRHDRRSIRLDAAHPQFASIPWRESCLVWGVVTSLHRDLTRPR
jgi:DNA polymerase V